MPWARPKPCAVPRCSHMQPCPIHAKPPRPWQDKRVNADKRGYGGDWAVARKRALKACRFECQRCGKRAVVVHHIVPITGPDDPLRLDPSNLECLCRECHERHHGRLK